MLTNLGVGDPVPVDSQTLPQADMGSVAEDSSTGVEKGRPHEAYTRSWITLWFPLRASHVPLPEERSKYPTDASLWSRISFSWVQPILKTGFRRTLMADDLFVVQGTPYAVENLARGMELQLDKFWQKGLEDAQLSGSDHAQYPKHSLVRAFNRAFFWQWWGAAVLKTLSDVGQCTSPLLLKRIIQFVVTKELLPNTPLGKGVGYSIGLVALMLVYGMLQNQFFYNAMLTNLIYKKALKLSNEGRNLYPNGKITNLMSSDCHRIDFAMQWSHFVWTFPVTLIISLAIVLDNIGAPGLVGFAWLVLGLVFVGFAGKQVFRYRARAVLVTDQRVSMLREILHAMRILKFYAWESSYEKQVQDVRHQESNIIRTMLQIRNVMNSVFVSISTIAGLLSFIVLSRTGHNLNPAAVFSSVTVFNIVRLPLLLMPLGIVTTADAIVAFSRIESFLSAPEVKEYLTIESSAHVAIRVQDASFEWQGSPQNIEEKANAIEVEKNPQIASKLDSKIKTEEEKEEEEEGSYFSGLHHIDLQVNKGEFIVVTGPIGSGKSSLLSALAGAMDLVEGSVTVSSLPVLCGQQWIQNSSLEENITFGVPFDRTRYRKTVEACALERDFSMMPAGDQSELGERGLTLSGGQKARVNLARAVYRDAEIYLLDDILSAVDAHVGKHIVNECLCKLLKGKTVVLATHQVSVLQRADRIVYLESSGALHVGKLDELQKSIPSFARLIELGDDMKQKSDVEDEEDVEVASPEYAEESELAKAKTSDSRALSARIKLKRQGQLIEDEDRQVHSVDPVVYFSFVKYGGRLLGVMQTPAVVFFLVASTFCTLFTTVWLSFWTGRRYPNLSQSTQSGIYTLIAVLAAFTSFCFYSALTAMTNNTGNTLHDLALKRVLRAPMYFFDASPLGRILNRFTKDLDTVDNETGDQARLFLTSLMTVLGTFIMIICYLPWFAIAVVGLMVIYCAASTYYRASAREIKRLDSLSRSHVYSHFSDSLNGLATIRAFRESGRFIARNAETIDRMDEAYFFSLANQRWLSLRLEWIGCAITLVLTLLCVSNRFKIDPSSVGLVISSMLQVSTLLVLIVREMATFENNMNAVERLRHYAFNLPLEAGDRVPEHTPDPEWPREGAIVFDQVCMSYRPHLPPVLKNVSLSVRPHEKIGICGRTGAGKSSIMTALYRLCELSSGSISIDGIDTSKIGLSDLRSRLSIIPQDPVIFQGTIRSNLDPFGEKTDEELYEAMRRGWLITESEIEQLKTGAIDTTKVRTHLDAPIADEGSNLSLGEKQLVALTRALVRKSKILILDEATSSVDIGTDSKIQSTIASEFKSCTVLCIAHRLNTIANYDRIIVLDGGVVAEFDSPANLYSKPEGLFRQMCDKAKVDMSAIRSD